MTSVLNTIARIVLGLLAAFLSLTAHTAYATPEHPTQIVGAISGQPEAAVPNGAASERGPPATRDRETTNDADGTWPHGSWARPIAATAGSTTTYAIPAKSAQGAWATGTTQRSVQGDVWALSSLAPSDVAANTAARPPHACGVLACLGQPLPRHSSATSSASSRITSASSVVFGAGGSPALIASIASSDRSDSR